MSHGKVHMLSHRAPGKYDVLVSLCKWPGGSARIVTSEDLVTCARCQAAMLVTAPPAIVVAAGWAPAVVGCREAMVLRGDVVRPLWWGWRSSVRHYIEWRDEGATLRSSSRPERFEAQTSGGSEHASGDAAQRDAERYAPVGAAIDAALEGIADPPTSIEGMRDVLARVLVGRRSMRVPMSQTGERRPKAAITVRIEDHERDIAELAGIAVSDVRRIVREAGQSIERYLHARGLVSHADVALDSADMGIRTWDVHGWPDIAAVIGVDSRTAQRWRDAHEHTDPMPVTEYAHVMRGTRRELEAWADRRAESTQRRRMPSKTAARP